MTPPRPTVSSLDALLQSTREQFDRTFADGRRQADAAGLRNRQRPSSTPAGGPAAPAAEPRAAAAPDIDAELNRRFGSDWSAELVETQVTGGTLSALYRLMADGRSALEFGDAPEGMDRDAALESARQSALAKAADTLAHGAQPSATAADRALPRTPQAAPRAAPASSGALDALTLDRIDPRSRLVARSRLQRTRSCLCRSASWTVRRVGRRSASMSWVTPRVIRRMCGHGSWLTAMRIRPNDHMSTAA